MTLINKEEEVLILQLTEYGRNALATGKFQPYCYKFFDDDIIYDVQYANQSELQSLVQDRILKDTARPRPPKLIYGVETRSNSGAEFIDKNKKYFKPNKIDEDMLLRDELLEGDSNKQDITHTSVSINSEYANFNTVAGVSKTTGSYTITKNYNVKATNNWQINIHKMRQSGGPGHWYEFWDGSILGEGLKLSFDEDHDFLDEEEYEFELYKIKRASDDKVPTHIKDGVPHYMLEEILIPLVESGGSSDSYIKRNKFFNIYIDEQVPEVWENSKEYKPRTPAFPIDVSEVVQETTVGDIDNIYENMDFEDSIKKCNQGDE